MPTPFTGGCACRAIRYECTAEPLVSWKCHCRDCQRAGGGTCFPGLYVPQAALTIKGESKYYDVKNESGNTVSRGFCPECGSPVFVRPALLPDLVGLWAASLDDPSWFQPEVELWTASAQPWASLNPTLLQVEKNPTEEQLQGWLTPQRGRSMK